MLDEQVDLVLLTTEENMQKSVESLERELASVRTGRANPALLDSISIDYYGALTPLKQIASIGVVEGTQLLIKPFDKSTIKQIEHAINASDIGIAPQSDATGIRLVLPSLTGERRKEISKKVEKIGEDMKVAIRNIRRTANDEIKKLDMPEDAEKSALDEVQKLTDKYVKVLEEVTAAKIKEVQTI
ncbi:ribosome recycling factor [Haploplasma axanthum]|uniref:Ribosome-recycling factor n=1 Tax=Haploplasma axanthum TaxID=29552 RepID=A0A449BCU1_HAPAX|nr:ribosome recycling factor [Haploplasma axanthum]VEU80256.1 ribosome recycling factor [Haploplasma axanthum]